MVTDSTPTSMTKKISDLLGRAIDVEKLFLKKEVQSILNQIAGFDLDKINSPRLMELQEAKVQLMTDEQLAEVGYLLHIF